VPITTALDTSLHSKTTSALHRLLDWLHPNFHWKYSLCLSMEGWPGWVDMKAHPLCTNLAQCGVTLSMCPTMLMLDQARL